MALVELRNAHDFLCTLILSNPIARRSNSSQEMKPLPIRKSLPPLVETTRMFSFCVFCEALKKGNLLTLKFHFLLSYPLPMFV
ncbi:hypothetical protein CEXT_251641 [Caerostris extrusa]|uniref:Uncharacterized protein n=1 Tax=Caerostris extrusa TaxID=172846 RepID=A0AAV4WLU6_CAEEX|nr:hypothetical protein CEXT_251641 [Caerostris extrusa]